MARLGLRASVQPAHLLDDRDLTERCWPDRGDRCFMFRTRCWTRAWSSRWAPTRRCPARPVAGDGGGGAPLGRRRARPGTPSRRSPPREALAASVDGRSVSAGAPADLALLDADPLAAPPALPRGGAGRPPTSCDRQPGGPAEGHAGRCHLGRRHPRPRRPLTPASSRAGSGAAGAVAEQGGQTERAARVVRRRATARRAPPGGPRPATGGRRPAGRRTGRAPAARPSAPAWSRARRRCTPKRWAPAYAAARARFFTTDRVRVGGATFIETRRPGGGLDAGPPALHPLGQRVVRTLLRDQGVADAGSAPGR